MKKTRIDKEAQRRQDIIAKIFDDYGKDVIVEFHNETAMCCYPHPDDRIIQMRVEQFMNPTNRDLFDLLHEFGHLETFKCKHRKFEREYFATQWALDHADEYGVEITARILNIFQEYIMGFYDKAKKRKVKNLPDVSEVRLEYNIENVLR